MIHLDFGKALILLASALILNSCTDKGGSFSETLFKPPTSNLSLAQNSSTLVSYQTATSIVVSSAGTQPTISITSNPSNGSVNINSYNGTTILYTPSAAYTGNDSFSFTITDGQSVTSGTATISIGILISNCTELQAIPDNATNTYILKNDIDCAMTSNWNNGAGFKPILNFNGTFDGNFKLISHLYIHDTTSQYYGLFGQSWGVIKNVGVILADVYGLGQSGGILVGESHGTISQSFVSGSINCDYSASVTMSGWSCGGLIGHQAYNATAISDSWARVTVSGANDYTGALMGVNNAGAILRSYGVGNISLKYGNRAAGLTTYTWSPVTDCFSDANVGFALGLFDQNVNNWSTTAGVNTGIATSDSFKGNVYQSGQQPFTSWNFSSIWEEVSGDYPRLRGFNYPANYY